MGPDAVAFDKHLEEGRDLMCARVEGLRGVKGVSSAG